MSGKKTSPDEFFRALAEAVARFDKSQVEALAHQAVENGLDAYEAIHTGLSFGMEVVGKKFDDGEYFIPELLMATKAMMKGVEILKPHISSKQASEKGIFVIGTVKGDTHSIGKDIVAIMLEASGFEVHNLGENVEHRRFMEKAEEFKADIVGLSALMSTTMNHMKDIIDLFKKEGLREKYLIMVGGAPVSQKWCDVVGADAFAPSAGMAVEVSLNLIRHRVNLL